jgi:hypothetical protein
VGGELEIGAGVHLAKTVLWGTCPRRVALAPFEEPNLSNHHRLVASASILTWHLRDDFILDCPSSFEDVRG